MLSRELAHIVLGHNLGSKYAFYDRMLFSDESTYQNLGFRHVPEEETAADKKAIELLKNSPYAQKLNTPGLFLREVAARGPALSALLTPHLGTGFTDRKQYWRFYNSANIPQRRHLSIRTPDFRTLGRNDFRLTRGDIGR